MADTGTNWFVGSLFLGTLLASATLMLAAALAPWVVERLAEPPDLLLLFGLDMTVRRTAFAASLGLCVTAFVFFRPGLARRRVSKEPPVNMTGA